MPVSTVSIASVAAVAAMIVLLSASGYGQGTSRGYAYPTPLMNGAYGGYATTGVAQGSVIQQPVPQSHPTLQSSPQSPNTVREGLPYNRVIEPQASGINSGSSSTLNTTVEHWSAPGAGVGPERDGADGDHRHNSSGWDTDRGRGFYGGGTIFANGPVYLGGYYYGAYCSAPTYPNTFYSVYSYYDGLPEFICTPSVIVLGQPYYPEYDTPYEPFGSSPGQTTYNTTNNFNYYLNNANPSANSSASTDTTTVQPQHPTFATGSCQAAFTDIEQAWADGNIDLITAHLRDSDTKISVNLKGKYAYSISSDDFAGITRDAFANLNTVSFQFTRLRVAENGDVTAYGKHVYVAQSTVSGTGSTPEDGTGTVPFDQSGGSTAGSTGGGGQEKTVYVSYTLRHGQDQWYIIGVNSSPDPIVASQ